MSSKPNAIVAQSGGPTTVINSSACGAVQEAMKSGKIGSVIGATNGILGVLKEDLFDISAEKPEIAARMRRAFRAWNEQVEASIAGHDYPEGRLVETKTEPRRWPSAEEYQPYLKRFARYPEYAGELARQ